MNYSNSEYAEDARTFLTENYGGTYTYTGIQKDKAGKYVIVTMKAANLNDKIVTVRFDITEHTAFSISKDTSSNYLPQKFKEQEEAYYADIFKSNLFADTKVIINNQKRLMKNLLNRDTNFNQYLDAMKYEYLNEKNGCSDFITIIATDNQSYQSITWEEKLKASFIDLKTETSILSGTFYLVSDIDADYENTCIHKVVFNGNLNSYDFDFKYEVKK
ncbi:MAG: hypothetical protein J5726_05370 [Treponema sp.]|nr:hypothetical protein [Treponema sp.]